MTQTLIIHVIRTNLIPFIQSRASWQLTMTTCHHGSLPRICPIRLWQRHSGLFRYRHSIGRFCF